jgi:hypothetical protein
MFGKMDDVDIKELTQLNNTNYFQVTATLLGGFTTLNRDNYEALLDKQGFDILIKDENLKEISFQFKHDQINYCDSSLDFNAAGELINMRTLILPVGMFKKRRTKRQLKTLRNLLQGIAKHQHAHSNTIKKRRQYRLVSNGLMITITRDKNAKSQPYVSVWCEYLPE